MNFVLTSCTVAHIRIYFRLCRFLCLFGYFIFLGSQAAIDKLVRHYLQSFWLASSDQDGSTCISAECIFYAGFFIAMVETFSFYQRGQ